MSRRSVPPRGRKGRNATSIAPPAEGMVAAPASVATPSAESEVRPAASPPLDEAAAVDAGWDELLG
jgi:hypothetical protein